MDRNSIPQDETESKTKKFFFAFTLRPHADAEQLMRELINEAHDDADRYFLYRNYGELLIKSGRWEEAWDVLIQSAQIASNHRAVRNEVEYYFGHELINELNGIEKEVLSCVRMLRAPCQASLRRASKS